MMKVFTNHEIDPEYHESRRTIRFNHLWALINTYVGNGSE
jgi:hypothetical protein